MVIQSAVEFAADFGGFGAEGGASALEEDHGNDVSVLRVRVRGEPAEASAVFGAGAGFAQDLLFTEVKTQAAGGPILDRAGHAFCDFWNERTDIELALHARLIVDNFVH